MMDSNDISSFSTVLIERAIGGDEAAFREIYNQISGKMYSLCVRYASNVEDANDFFQEGFIKLYRHLPKYRFEGSFEGWARTIFVSSCLDALKRRKVKIVDVDEELNIADFSANANDKLQMEELLNLVNKLPEGYRTIVNLYLIEDYSHKEIAEMLDITESGSKSKLHKARIFLKQLISEEYVN